MHSTQSLASTNRSVGALVFLLIALGSPVATAASECDYLLSYERRQCLREEAAERASAARAARAERRAKAEADRQARYDRQFKAQRDSTNANGSVRTESNRNQVKRDEASRSLAAPTNPDTYVSKSFVGLDVWAQAFAQEANDAAGFSAFMAKMRALATSLEAKANAMVNPQRNEFQLFLADHRLYKAYGGSGSALLQKQNQCLEPRTYSAAEACDCVAGFPGDAAIGPGAGEIVTQKNATRAINACGRAADLAVDARSKARFTAQKARAQIYKMDTMLADRWADEAIAGGYRRALIVKARAPLRDIEVRVGGVPPMSESQFNAWLKSGIERLKVAKGAGVWETFILAEQYQEVRSNLAFNDAVLTPLLREMMQPPAPRR